MARDGGRSDGDIGTFFAGFAAAHMREDVPAYVASFAEDAVWVTGRGVVHRGRRALDEYLRQVLPGGLSGGAVRYVVESVHPLGAAARLVVVEQTYLDGRGQPRDERAAHTHTYVVLGGAGGLRIAAGQNTVRA